MQDILIVVDMQNDFISGSLGTEEAQKILPNVKRLIENFNGKVYYTRDTHYENYLETKEGKNLPVEHCIKNTYGWEICDELKNLKCDGIIDKPTFGSLELVNMLLKDNDVETINSITLCGLCTDICVISNAMLLKSAFLDSEIIVNSSCSAGVTPDSHNNAISAMKMCQIKILF